jgi:hypothetical protein
MGYTARQVESSIFIAKEDVERLGETLEDEHAWGWQLFRNENGDVVELYFVGEKPNHGDVEFLKSIAPYAKDNSFVELVGEDGLRWRWVIRGKEVWEQLPDIKWKTTHGPL